MSSWRGWTGCTRRSSVSRPNWSACAPCSNRAKRIASRSITRCASWATIWRAPIRALSVARLELERLRRDAEKSADQRERNRAAVAEKERLRAEREEALETQRRRVGEAGGPGGDHRRGACGDRAPELAGLEERYRGERSAHGPPGAAVPRDHQPAQRHRAGDFGGWANSAHGCWRTTSNSTRRAALLAEQITTLETQVNEMATQDAALREALRTDEEELKGLRAAVQEMQEKRSQIEIDLVRKQAELKYPRRNQPQGAGLPGGRALGRGRPDPGRRRHRRSRAIRQRSAEPDRRARVR